MSVWYRQTADGEVLDGPRQINPHFVDQTDADLLALKATGASSKDWTVEWTSERSFTATKIRWEAEAVCIREFWMDD